MTYEVTAGAVTKLRWTSQGATWASLKANGSTTIISSALHETGCTFAPRANTKLTLEAGNAAGHTKSLSITLKVI